MQNGKGAPEEDTLNKLLDWCKKNTPEKESYMTLVFYELIGLYLLVLKCPHTAVSAAAKISSKWHNSNRLT